MINIGRVCKILCSPPLLKYNNKQPPERLIKKTKNKKKKKTWLYPPRPQPVDDPVPCTLTSFFISVDSNDFKWLRIF